MADQEIISQLAGVRSTGAVNMINKSGVQRTADECGFNELVVFIDESSNTEYMDALQEMGDQR